MTLLFALCTLRVHSRRIRWFFFSMLSVCVCIFQWQVVSEDRHGSWRSMTVGAEIPVIEPLAIDLHQWYITGKYSWEVGVPRRAAVPTLITWWDHAARALFKRTIVPSQKSKKASFQAALVWKPLMPQNTCTGSEEHTWQEGEAGGTETEISGG